MKAIVATRIGGPEVLELQDVPGPQLRDNQILVNVDACGVNFADIMMSQGSYAGGPKPPFIIGREFAGHILASGERVMGYTQGGAFAERIVTPPNFVWPIPDGWTIPEAAAFPVNYFTALFAYWWAGFWSPAGVRQDPEKPASVLIHAVAGGVGTA